MITLANPVAWWAVPLLVLAAAWLAWSAYARPGGVLSSPQRILLTLLRFSTLLLLVLLLMRPVMLEPAALRRDAIVPVLVDVSRSMRVQDAQGVSRVARAAEIVRDEVLPALKDEYRAEVLTFGERLAEADPAHLVADDRRSDLAGAIQAVHERYRGQALAGIVVVSDGGDTSAAEPVEPLRRVPVPVYAVGVGASPLARDREVLGIAVSARAMADSVVRLNASVVSHGYAGATFDVRVLENGRVTQVRHVTPRSWPDDTPILVDVPVMPNRDVATVYTVEIPAAPGELVAENNTRSVLIRPAPRRRRVLLAQGAPGYEHSFLARALLRDPALEIDSVVRKGRNDRGELTFYIQAAASRTGALTGGFPVTREALFAYDAVILANLEGDFLRKEQLTLAAAFVAERGGGLLALGGRSFDRSALAGTPLEEVLPVELGRGNAVLRTSLQAEPNRVRLTADGETHPIMQFGTAVEESRKRWSELPPLATSAALGAARPGATVLATSGPAGIAARPVVAVQRYGRGRSMVFAGEGAWRWRMLLPSEDRTFDTFWRQAVRWLSEEATDPIAVSSPPALMPEDEAVATITVRDAAFAPIPDASVSAELIDPDGKTTSVPVSLVDGGTGRYAARVRPAAAGIHRLRVDARRGGTTLGRVEDHLLVGGEDLELTDPRLNEEVLRRLASASGGQYRRAGDLGDIRAALARPAPETLPPVARDLWHNAWTCAALVLLLSTEWVLRRRSGLR